MDVTRFFTVDFDEPDGIVTITLDRQDDKYNTFGMAFALALQDVLTHYQQNPTIRAMVLTATGTKVFSTGADIVGQFTDLDSMAARDFSYLGHKVFAMLEDAPYITLAAINGFALGGGLEIALACNFRVASKRARLGLPEINLGVLPGWGGTQRLQRIVGQSRALQMILSGDPISAGTALEWGLVSAVFPPEELVEGAKKFLRQFTSKSGDAVRVAKRTVVNGAKMHLEDALKLESEGFGLLWSGPDREEGVKAFLEKRKPKFTT
jgi:enoyl-CoA hydratase